MNQSEFEANFQVALEGEGFEGLTKRDVQAILDTLGGEIEKALRVKAKLSNGSPATPSVIVRGLGKWSISDRKARMGRNPATGAVIKIKASKKLKVLAAKPVRDRLKVK
jgi:DNA-binding protein HU-beta